MSEDDLVALDHYDAKSGTTSYKSLLASPNHEVMRRPLEAAAK